MKHLEFITLELSMVALFIASPVHSQPDLPLRVNLRGNQGSCGVVPCSLPEEGRILQTGNDLLPGKVDVTDVTGAEISSTLTAWTVPNGDLLVEHLAGCAPNGDLLVYFWQPGQNWRVVNVSQITEKKISGPVASWVVPNGDVLVEHLAGVSPDGELLVFYWMSGQDWQVVNVSEITGQTIAGPITSWVVPNGDLLVEHLAGVTPDGELFVFFWQPGQDWRAVSVTQLTGEAIRGPVTSWVTPNGDRLVEHLAGSSLDGDLLVFYWIPESDWQVINVSDQTTEKAPGPFCSWMTWSGDRLVEHIAGPNENGELLVFFWMPGQDWAVVNVSEITGVNVKGKPSPYQIEHDGIVEEVLVALGQDDSLYLMWWSSALDWQALNFDVLGGDFQSPPGCGQCVDEPTGWYDSDGPTYDCEWYAESDHCERYGDGFENMGGTANEACCGCGGGTMGDGECVPEAWTVLDGNVLVEHIAAVDNRNHLVVSWYDAYARQITDMLIGDFSGLTQPPSQRHFASILWDPHRPDHPAPARQVIEDEFLGTLNSARKFFEEASLGRFDFQVMFLPPSEPGRPGWYDALKPADHYWDNPDPSSPNATRSDPNYHHNTYNDNFLSGHQEKWAEAVWIAANDIDFSAFDYDGSGTLDIDELPICIMIPQRSASGYQRTPHGQQVPAQVPLRSDGVNSGVVIPTILEVYSGIPPHVGLLSHELAHLLLNAVDMYHGWPPENEYVPFTVGPFSLMGLCCSGNLDPFHRLKYGWLRHRVVLGSGHYQLQAAVPHGEALILIDPSHSLNEYFILEVRWNTANSIDASLPDTGLAVWHIIEDSAIFNLSPTPVGTDEIYWASTVNSWSRRGVRLIRPVVTPPTTNNRQALWDGSDPATGYDLLSDDPDPQHSELRWVSTSIDGIPSGFAIRNISAAGPVMTLNIEVPW